MIDAGNGVIEIFRSGGGGVGQGVIRHFALADTQVDDTIEKIRQAGYEIIVEPKDVTIASTPAFPARIAFCMAAPQLSLMTGKGLAAMASKSSRVG